jgi:hypothetical protein
MFFHTHTLSISLALHRLSNTCISWSSWLAFMSWESAPRMLSSVPIKDSDWAGWIVRFKKHGPRRKVFPISFDVCQELNCPCCISLLLQCIWSAHCRNCRLGSRHHMSPSSFIASKSRHIYSAQVASVWNLGWCSHLFQDVSELWCCCSGMQISVVRIIISSHQ